MVSPIRQLPIHGESNVARFLSRLLPSTCPLNYDCLDWDTLVRVDTLLDLPDQIQSPSSLLQQLETTLKMNKNGKFLLHTGVSIADFVLFSTLLNSFEIGELHKMLNGKPLLQTWFKNMENYGHFHIRA